MHGMRLVLGSMFYMLWLLLNGDALGIEQVPMPGQATIQPVRKGSPMICVRKIDAPPLGNMRVD